MNLFFWCLWGFDAIIAIVVLYFFFIGLADGSVSSFNSRLWMGLLAVVAGVLLGSLWLKSANNLLAAKSVLCILAVPGFLYLLFILVMLTNKKPWN